MSDFAKFISENMYVSVAALYVLGMFLKGIPKIPDFIIPFVLLITGIVFGVLISGGLPGVLQGILCAGAAVYANQLLKQGIEGIKSIFGGNKPEN